MSISFLNFQILAYGRHYLTTCKDSVTFCLKGSYEINPIVGPTDFGGWSYELIPVRPSVCPSICVVLFVVFLNWLQSFQLFA